MVVQCKGTSICYTVVGIGLIENSFAEEVIIYPNPITNDKLSVDLGKVHELVTVTISGVYGTFIESNLFYKGQLLELVLENWPAGVYLLMIGLEDKRTVFKLVKN